MYGEETLKYISCLLKKGTKVCSFTFYIFYAQKCINCRNLLIYVNMCIFKNINLNLTVVKCRHWQVVLGSTFLEKERYFHIWPRSERSCQNIRNVSFALCQTKDIR